MGGLFDTLGGIVGNLPGGGALGGLLGGGGSAGGLPIIGGLLGGGQQNPAATPQGWNNYAGLQQPGMGTFPVQQTPQAPQYNFHGDVSGPGTAETFYGANGDKFGAPTASGQFWSENQGNFGKPGQGEQYWSQVAGNFNAPKATSNNAQGAYDQFRGSVPANLDPYYNAAIQKAEAGVNNAYGARGQFNSSAALQGVADVNAQLRAQQAKDEADYGLQRSALGGTLAGAADASSRGASQDMLGWLTGGANIAGNADRNALARLMGGGNLAGQADAAGLSSLMSGMNAANMAQNAEQGRANDYFRNLLAMGNAQAGAMGSVYPQMMGTDLSLLDQSNQAMLGYPREALNQGINGRASTEQGLSNGIGLFGQLMGAMKGG